MPDVPTVTPLAWFGLVIVYATLGWWRGASLRTILGMPAMITAIVVAEFTVPAVLARTGDPRLAIVWLGAALAVGAYCLRLTRIVTTPSAMSGSRISPKPPGATVWNQWKMSWSVSATALTMSPSIVRPSRRTLGPGAGPTVLARSAAAIDRARSIRHSATPRRAVLRG